MHTGRKKYYFILLSMLVVLSGCTNKNAQNESEENRETVDAVETAEPTSAPLTLPDGREAEPDITALSIEGDVSETLEQWKAALLQLPELQEIEITDETLSPEELSVLRESTEACIHFTPVVNGVELDLSAESLSLTNLKGEEVSAYLPWLPLMTELREIDLGEESEERNLSWEDILDIERAAPNAQPLYSFQLFDKSFTLLDTTLDLNHRKMDDRGELVRRVVRCMPNLETLDMDLCGVEDEDMAAIREEFPQVKVIWRIFFGGQYTCRTDVEKILASWPAAGYITDYNCSSLKYCTEVKYLDIGHNVPLTDISFVSYMPNLEVCILAYLQYLTDISPLADCPHLEYLELMQCNVEDVSALGGLQELRHVNLVLNPVSDISCLYELTDLERLYLGYYSEVPEEQTDEMLRRNPDLEIDRTSCTPRGGKWRGEYEGDECIYVERYILLKEQFGYRYPTDYALKDGDPLYDYHG